MFGTAQTITLNGTVLEIDNVSEPVTITGPGAGVTINGNNASQGVAVDPSTTVSLMDLTISNCTAGVGGGIINQGTLTIENCTISNNDATSNDDGGGFANEGTATLINDTFAGNIGNGINQRGGTLTVSDCTISGNSSYAPYPAGGIYQQGGTATIGNTIIAGNTSTTGSPDVFGPFISEGNNLIGGADSGSTGWISTDLTGTDAAPLSPVLGALANNGGPTETMLPLAGSPAIGAGSVALIPTGIVTDQRGLSRLHNGLVDIGSVESGADQTFVESIGNLDLSFGNRGLASHDVGLTTTAGVAPDGTQSIIIGTSGTAPNESFGVTRYNADGSLDTSFGSGGVVSTSFNGTDDVPAAVEVLPSGAILVAGTATTYTNGAASGSEFAVVEYNADGSLNTSFGNGTGEVLISFSTTMGTLSNDVLSSVAISNSGVIYLGGSSDASGTSGTDFAIAALTATGIVDGSFGTGGQVLKDFAGGDDAINSLAIQANGDIVAAGSATIAGITEIALARFLANGVEDSHFGVKGNVTTNVRGLYDSASSVVIQPTGQIVIGGISATGSVGSVSSDFVLVRYTAAGVIDRTFGGGPVVTSFGQPSAITQLVLQSNGEIVASGKTTPSLLNVTPGTLDIALARYTTRGVLDSAFNGTGQTIIDLSVGVVTTASSHTGTFSDMTIQPLDASSLGSAFSAFVGSQQGVVSVTTGGEILDVGNSGSDTVEAELITAGVDLVTSLLSQPPVAVVGGLKATASVSIAEAGTNLATGIVTIEIEVATDSAGDGATPIKSISEHISLREKQSHSYRIAFVYPASITTGSYFLVANVDNGSAPSLADLDTENNLSASTHAVNIAPPFISLAVSGLSATSTLIPGKVAHLIFTLINNGNVTAKGATTADLTVSPDETTADGTPLPAIKLVAGLLAGKSRVYHLTLKLPITLTAGTDFLIAVIDPLDNLGSTDQTSTTTSTSVVVS